MGHSFRFWRPFNQEAGIQEQALRVLELVGMLEHGGTVAGNLAYGDQRRLEIAIAIAMDPKLLILDEPLAGMGKSDSIKIVEFIKSLKKQYTIFLIEHDMDAVFSLADHISVMVYGRVIASGSPESVRKDELVRSAYLGQET